jgi:hypothetical protein
MTRGTRYMYSSEACSVEFIDHSTDGVVRATSTANGRRLPSARVQTTRKRV